MKLLPLAITTLLRQPLWLEMGVEKQAIVSLVSLDFAVVTPHHLGSPYFRPMVLILILGVVDEGFGFMVIA
jgi:hypothetical protein